MMKYKKLPENILDLLPGAVDFLTSHPKVIFSYLFGSLARRHPSPLSDVDIAVYYKDELEEIINLQPLRDGKAKAYQVKQVRMIILKYKLHKDVRDV